MKRLARLLVEERLAACAQLLGPMTSIYRWDGEVESSAERLLLAKTARNRVSRLIKRVEQEHPYEVPEILAVTAATASKRYFDWVATSVKPRG